MVSRHNVPCDLDPQSTAVLARIAHEMSQPLSAATAAVRLIKQRDDGDRHARACGVLERQCTRLSRLIEDLLIAAQIRSDTIAVRYQEVDLGRLVADVAESFRPLVAERRLRFDVQVPAQPCWISGDPIRLEQVFSNILTNAMKYTDPGGRLWATMMAANGDARVTIGDTGHGIASEMLPRVFEMFATGSSDPGHGLGIGLAVARQLVELHGGTITVSSEGRGRGTEVVVTIPRLTESTMVVALMRRSRPD